MAKITRATKIGLAFWYIIQKREGTSRRFWVHPMWEKRHRSGSYRILLPELKQHAEKFHSYMRMNLSEFNNLLAVVTPWLTRRSIRTPINPEERLMLTLRFLATGEAFRSLSFQFRLGVSTVSKIVASTCCAIFNALKTDYLQVPATEEEWIDIAAKFFSRWNCPNTLGAIDGKHVLIKRPPHSGSLYYNYKGTFSTVLLAVCDADYRCIYASYGHYGHQGDAGIFDRGDFKKAIENGSLHLPTDSSFPFTNGSSLPFFFVGDGAFPLSRRMMKPFPGQRLSHHKQIYNYRISRARRLIENFFGILACSYRVLLKPLETKISNNDNIIKACLALHNFNVRHAAVRLPQNLADTNDQANGEWREQIEGLLSAAPDSNYVTQDGKNIQQKLMEYFNGAGSVEWQEERIGWRGI